MRAIAGCQHEPVVQGCGSDQRIGNPDHLPGADQVAIDLPSEGRDISVDGQYLPCADVLEHSHASRLLSTSLPARTHLHEGDGADREAPVHLLVVARPSGNDGIPPAKELREDVGIEHRPRTRRRTAHEARSVRLARSATTASIASARSGSSASHPNSGSAALDRPGGGGGPCLADHVACPRLHTEPCLLRAAFCLCEFLVVEDNVDAPHTNYLQAVYIIQYSLPNAQPRRRAEDAGAS